MHIECNAKGATRGYPSPTVKEANLSCPHAGEYNHIPFLPLKAIHRPNLDSGARCFVQLT